MHEVFVYQHVLTAINDHLPAAELVQSRGFGIVSKVLGAPLRSGEVLEISDLQRTPPWDFNKHSTGPYLPKLSTTKLRTSQFRRHSVTCRPLVKVNVRLRLWLAFRVRLRFEARVNLKFSGRHKTRTSTENSSAPPSTEVHRQRR